MTVGIPMKMKSPWRKEAQEVEKAISLNQKLHFSCTKCGVASDAPSTTSRSSSQLCTSCFGKRKDERENQLNDLTGSEWASLSKSVQQYEGTRSEKQRLHGAAFPKSLVEAHVKTYTKIGQLVLDPFLGVGTTSEVCEALGRQSVGIELNPEFVKLAGVDIKDFKTQRIIAGSALDLGKFVEPNSVDFVITSPPYATLLKTIKGSFGYKWREHSKLSVLANPEPYSKHEQDLGNLTYSDFLDAILAVQIQCYEVLKSNTYAVWVVKDYRDLKGGAPYVNFHGDIIRVSEAAGFRLWDIRVYDQTKFRPLVVLGYPSRNYYLNIGHSYILIFKK